VKGKVAGSAGVGSALVLLLFFLAIPMLIVGGTSLFFASGGSGGCTTTGSQAPAAQPGISSQGKQTIPSNFLTWYKKVGMQYNIPWTILAGIGTEESDNGQSRLPGVLSGTNAFGAAGPMQIGVGGASTDTWATVATSEDGLEPPNVYDPADAIAGAAKYLNLHGFQQDPSAAIFAYNHATWYVTAVENYANEYASGGFLVSQNTPNTSTGQSATECAGTILDALNTPNVAVATAIQFAEEQIGKPYVFGATGPDAYDCSGLVMMAYRAAEINIPRTSSEQYHFGAPVAASAVSPGDLVFFAGADGTTAEPGHVGLVIGKNTMIEAYATGFPVRISTFGLKTSAPGEQTGQVVGFTRPWKAPGLKIPESELAPSKPSSSSSSSSSKSGAPTRPAHPTKGGTTDTVASTAANPKSIIAKPGRPGTG
jgi:peptidoglycan DL-endopeptidase CwlO